MAYARIRLNFETMNKAYRDYKSLPMDIADWMKNQNDWEDKENERRKQQSIDEGRTIPSVGHSTSCCFQASLGFNATPEPIPKTGSRDRENTTLKGKNYILAVDEFRAYLTRRYGPTEQVDDLDTIKGDRGVLIFGNSHIEFWDGEDILQSPGGARRRGGNPGAVMAGGVMNGRPRWFWEIGEDASPESAVVPEWAQGWWTVYDGNYYYYFFFHDGNVNYIETKPNPKWIPPKTIGNRGKVTLIANGFSILWKPTPGESASTKEDFYRVNWSSTTEMNGVSNKYSPLYAKKMS
jgi:hypothetical protein